MRRKLRLGFATTVALTLALVMIGGSASAEYVPGPKDVVGIGSDTLQFAVDFVFDGFPGASGFNALGNLYKGINIDATADANSRVAYANNGIGAGQCHPGTGAAAGTGNDNTDHANNTCFLNPTVVLRAGFAPVLRPNGSGAGFDAFRRDVDNAGTDVVDFARSSVCQGTGTGCRGKIVTDLVSVKIGDDPFAILKSTTPASNAVPLSAAQIKSIYEANTPNCLHWTDVGGTSTDLIKPIIPQTASGTFSSFAASVGITTLGNCGVQFEENDPTAIHASGDAANAIMPMSGGRLNLYLGLKGDGSANGFGGYFKDPSCPAFVTTPAACVGAARTLTPDVTLVTTGTPSSGTLWNITRPLYLYFRQSDLNEATPWQPGSTLNWVRTLFYNPCATPGGPGCSVVNGIEYGPGGPPYIAQSAGQSLVSFAGIPPAYTPQVGGP